ASFDQTGTRVLACTDDRQLRSWPVDGSPRETAVAVGERAESVRRSYSFLADGRLAIHTNDDRGWQVDLYSPGGWIATKRPAWPASNEPPTAPFFNPGGRGTIMFGSGGSRMDVETGRALPPLVIGSRPGGPLREPIDTTDTF